ncbi:hypothetical protein CGLAU_04015 [Corynebacterium glaucum]|uniref:SWIM-type domain-containing protein n=2 Tax=Corynebacterium glaucum TaxID=187491 RepID=A0A1Q2HVA0_9CORY|nr:SWIM zinc finger family protein [Corynebacterium glaucum]AQQ14779.1 hypothetical protein CGLAU_04015 [Corynebacterium glaucum]
MEEQRIIARLREFSATQLDQVAKPVSIARATDIPGDYIALLEVQDDELQAQIVGTQPYLITLRLTAKGVSASCTCSVRDEWCKHAIAVAVHAAELKPGGHPLLDAALDRMTAVELVQLVNALRAELPQVEPVLTRLAMPHWFDPNYSEAGGAKETHAVLREQFLAEPSIATFAAYLDAPEQTYIETMITLAELGRDTDYATFELMAATEFSLYEEGLLTIETSSVDSFVAATWAVGVELPRDPVTAVRRLFAYFRLWLTQASSELPPPRTPDSAAHVALRIAQLQLLLMQVEDPDLATDGLYQWEGQLDLLRSEFQFWPHFADALADYEL